MTIGREPGPSGAKPELGAAGSVGTPHTPAVSDPPNVSDKKLPAATAPPAKLAPPPAAPQLPVTTQPGTDEIAEGDDDGGKPMTFWEHLDELRKRLVWSVLAFLACCIVAWELRETIMGMLVEPFVESWKAQNVPGNPTLHFDAPGAAFVAYFKLSMIGGVAMAAPIIFYQLWSFVAPGLYAKEKRFVIPFVLASSLLFVGGGYFGWRAAFPITFNYFLSLAGAVGGQHLVITPTVMMNQYIDFVAQMLLAFGIIFEIPLFILFLSLAGIVNYLQLIRFGRWFVLVAFVFAAIVTPPEATSQIMMALPMIVLYGFSIGLAYLFGKPPTEAQREAYRKRKEPKTEPKT